MKRAGQVVLFRFPHTDLAAGKLRPALLLGIVPGPYDDWLVCMISSQIRQHVEGFDEVGVEGDEDFVGSGLKRPSVVRLGRLAVVEGAMIEGAIGEIGSERLRRIKTRLADWIAA